MAGSPPAERSPDARAPRAAPGACVCESTVPEAPSGGCVTGAGTVRRGGAVNGASAWIGACRAVGICDAGLNSVAGAVAAGRRGRRRPIRRHVRGLDAARVAAVDEPGRLVFARRGRGQGARDRDAGPATRRDGVPPVENRAQLLAVLRPLVRPQREHPRHGLEEARRHAGHDPALDRLGVVLDRARGRRRRRRAEQQVVDHRAERVEVGPRALPHAASSRRTARSARSWA